MGGEFSFLYYIINPGLGSSKIPLHRTIFLPIKLYTFSIIVSSSNSPSNAVILLKGPIFSSSKCIQFVEKKVNKKQITAKHIWLNIETRIYFKN